MAENEKTFRPRRAKRKVCTFCVDHSKEIDYKDVARLKTILKTREIEG